MDAFKCGARHQRAFARHTEYRGTFHREKRTQALAAIQTRIAHGLDQPMRARDFTWKDSVRQQAHQQRLGVRRRGIQPFGKILR